MPIHRKPLRMIWIALTTVVGVYLALAILLFLFQARLVYFPSRTLIGQPSAGAFEEVSLKTSDGLTLHAWFLPPPNPAAPVVLFCHGNGGNISYHLDLLETLRSLGAGLLLFDYRGYGRSQGAPNEEGTYLDADAAWAHLTVDRKIAPSRIVLHGWSLGGGVASHLAARVQPAGLILESTFTSLVDRGAEIYPYLPIRLMARTRYPTLERLARIHCPLLVIHSPDDQVIPIHHARRLFAAAGEPKRFLEIVGDHNGGSVASGALYTDALGAFLRDCMSRPVPAAP